MTSRPPPDDDERTVWPGAPRSAGPADPGDHALPAGTLIEGYRITRVLGEGGFGIVYLAWDLALDRPVAIKEYMPSSLAVRAHTSFGVSARSEQYRETFEAGLKSFLNEARLLARFDHPALVKVFRFWQANRTAYMAMPYYEGPTLKAALALRDGPVSEAQLREWLKPLLDALAAIHRVQCYHRDVSPDNILLTDTGPLLLDFGAARRVISDMTQALTAVLKPGYAPIEQYGGAAAQGPWTDLYALAGVVHFAITGRPPLPSVERVVNDTQPSLASTHAGQYGEKFLRAIDTALSMRPEARPQDVAQFVAMLDVAPPPAPSPAPVPVPAREAPKTTSVFRRASKAVTERLSRTRNLTRTRTPGQPPFVGAASRPATPTATASASAAAAAKAKAKSERESTSTRGRGKAIVAFAAAALLLAGGAAWWWMTRASHAPPIASVPATPEAVAPTTSAPEPQPTPAAVAPPTAPARTSPPVAEPSLAERPTAPEPAPAAAPEQAPAAEPPVASQAPAPAARPRPIKPAAPAVERPRPVASNRTAAEPRTAAAPESPPATPPNVGRRPARCGDIVLKSSMESLSPEEVAFLRRECR